MAASKTIRITELLGDGISPELRESVHTVADSLPIKFEWIPIDLSLENREKDSRDLFAKLEESMKDTRLAVKYPTTTKAVVGIRLSRNIILLSSW